MVERAPPVVGLPIYMTKTTKRVSAFAENIWLAGVVMNEMPTHMIEYGWLGVWRQA